MVISAYSGKARIFIAGQGWSDWMEREEAEAKENARFAGHGKKRITLSGEAPAGTARTRRHRGMK